MMILTLVALLMNSAVIVTAEDWDLVALAPEWAYAIDLDSIVAQGPTRTFDAVKVKPGGIYQRVNLIVDCSRMTVCMNNDPVPCTNQGMLDEGSGMRTPLEPEIAAIGYVCSGFARHTDPSPKVDFPTLLRNAQALMENSTANQARSSP